MKLSDHFYLSEFTRSQTASRKGIDNIPTAEDTQNMKLVCEKILEPLREKYGKPIYVSSGYRSSALNFAIGGSTSSQHMSGEAVDIDSAYDNKILFDLIKSNLEFDQLIWEYGTEIAPAWVHVSYKNVNRNQIIYLS